MRAAARRRDERGAGSALALGVVLAICVATGVALWVVGWINSAHRAQRAADVLALAVVSAQGDCQAARGRAALLQVELSKCSVRGTSPNLVATVTVSATLRPVVAGAPQRVQVTAAAASGELLEESR